MLMRDISGFLFDLDKLTGSNRAIAEEMNGLLRQYEREMDAMETVYDILGARPFYMDFDEEGNMTSCIWSDRYRKRLGYENEEDFPDEIESWIKTIDEEDRERVVAGFYSALKGEDGSDKFEMAYKGHKKDGELRYIHSVGIVRRWDNGQPMTLIGLSEDTTERTINSMQLQEQYEIVEALSRDYLNIFMVDIPGRTASIIKLNGYVTEGFGDIKKRTYPYEPFCAQYIKDRVYIEDQEMLTEMMSLDRVKEMLEKNATYEYGYRAVDNGKIHFYQFTFLKLDTKSGYNKVIAGFKNIDAIVASAKERDALKVLSETDIMTGTFNRGYGEKLARELVDKGEKGMLCIFDLDKFKEVNDTYGHNAGDKALISVARALKHVFGEDNIVFRLGGDEFSAVARNVTDKKKGRELIERFFKEIDNLDIPELSGSKIFTSVGAAFFGGEECDDDFEELYKKADTCVYESKKTTGNIVNFYA